MPGDDDGGGDVQSTQDEIIGLSYFDHVVSGNGNFWMFKFLDTLTLILSSIEDEEIEGFFYLTCSFV